MEEGSYMLEEAMNKTKHVPNRLQSHLIQHKPMSIPDSEPIFTTGWSLCREVHPLSSAYHVEVLVPNDGSPKLHLLIARESVNINKPT